jgi:hypothetical protein
MKRTIILTMTVMMLAVTVQAQHDHHRPADTSVKKAVPVKTVKDTTKKKLVPMDHSSMPGMDHQGHDMKEMPSHAFSRNLPMSRNSSGTAWNPDASPMYMWMKQGKQTDWMLHGNIFLRYTNTDIFNSGQRGDDGIGAPNWLMGMMNRKVGKKGLFNATVMLSLDPLTEGGNGYPLLFQSGETYKGRRLVDRQHPHDLFSAISIGYTQALSKDIDVFGYVGYPGEPALGAPAFMHRVSSMNNPDAPLGHHWQDATHITFGVATLGVRYKNFKLEGSSFTGREPDEDRYNFDKPRFGSYSYRVSYNPSANWAVQFSQGFIKEPELLEPGVDITRTTASVLYAKNLNKENHISAALIWGLNNKGDNHKEHSVLAEANYQAGKNAVFGRYEFIQKSTEELELEDQLGHSTYDIHVFSLGYNRSFLQKGPIELAGGVKTTINLPASALQPLYGKSPVGLQVYLQLRPALHRH